VDSTAGYTIKEAAGILRVSVKTLRRRILAGEVKAEKVEAAHGPTYFIPADVVHELANTQSTVTDIVAVKRPADAAAIALVVSEVVRQRDQEWMAKVDKLTAKMEWREKMDARNVWQRIRDFFVGVKPPPSTKVE